MVCFGIGKVVFVLPFGEELLFIDGFGGIEKGIGYAFVSQYAFVRAEDQIIVTYFLRKEGLYDSCEGIVVDDFLVLEEELIESVGFFFRFSVTTKRYDPDVFSSNHIDLYDVFLSVKRDLCFLLPFRKKGKNF